MNGLGNSRGSESCDSSDNSVDSSETKIRAEARPDRLDPLYLTWLALMEGRFKMIKPKCYSWVELFKILMSKLVSLEGWTLEDWTFFNESLLQVSLQADKDLDFRRKFAVDIKTGNSINKYINSRSKLRFPIRQKSVFQMISEKEGHRLTPNLWYSQGRQKFLKFPPAIEIKLRPSRFDRPKALDNGKYIGVGYRDKGNTRKLASDGQQSWQELCNDWRLAGSESDSTSFPSKEEGKK